MSNTVLNLKAMYELKWNYNYNLNRYYNGCNYIEEHINEADKYLPELMSIKENIEILLDEIMKHQQVSENEILNGFDIQ